MVIVAIDPGTTDSAFVVWDGRAILAKGKVANPDLMTFLADCLPGYDCCVIEMIASYGMAVGAEVFETCVNIGRFMECFGSERCSRITRMEVKNHLCHSSRAKDANIRQALIDRLGPVGTKKQPGALYGVSGDVWAALAVAVTWLDKNGASCR